MRERKCSLNKFIFMPQLDLKKKVTHYIYIKILCLKGHFFLKKKEKEKRWTQKHNSDEGKKKKQTTTNEK